MCGQRGGVYSLHSKVWPSCLAPTSPFDFTFDWISSGTVTAGCLYGTLYTYSIHIQYIDMYRGRTVQIQYFMAYG